VLYLGGFIFLLAATGIAFYQRNRRLKIQGQKIKAELQMQLLRSQMNPHFIFNSLNGIENFILKNDKRQASEYLNKFARLIRIILSNSRKEGVAFTDDMETIQLYIDLELLRFNNKFCYIKDIDPALLEADYRVPPLLIQPFVENAIVHGFAYSGKRELQLLITSKLEDDYIIYKIEDNGVGRAEAAVYKARNKSKHVSLGLQITNERINIFNEQHHAQNMLKIEDLYDVKGQPSGTSITIKVKTI
ncbi:MAG: sensor histidine kinase, partial [Ginsengibacter sp.]